VTPELPPAPRDGAPSPASGLPVHPPTVAAPLVRPQDARPGAGTAVVELLVALGLASAAQILVGAVIGFVAAVGGTKPDMTTLLSHPLIFMAIVAPVQVAFVAVMLFGLRNCPGRRRVRLGFVRARAGIRHHQYVVFVTGTFVPAIAGAVLASLVAAVVEPGNDVAETRARLTWATAIPFTLFIALVPGFVEEAFFRGYIQRRLLQRWRPWKAILFTSAAFALVHLEPSQIAFTFPVGIWLGILAWRTGSIWPGVAAHAVLNAIWNIIGTVGQRDLLPEWTGWAFTVLLVSLGLSGFVYSVVLLVSMRRVAVIARPISVEIAALPQATGGGETTP
jgi:uncharacterized protein